MSFHGFQLFFTVFKGFFRSYNLKNLNAELTMQSQRASQWLISPSRRGELILPPLSPHTVILNDWMEKGVQLRFRLGEEKGMVPSYTMGVPLVGNCIGN